MLKKVDLLEFKSAVIEILLVRDEAGLMPRVEKGIGHSRQERADLWGFLVPSTHPYPPFLRRNKFLPSLKAFNFMVCAHAKEELLLNPRAWYLNWGNTDVI